MSSPNKRNNNKYGKRNYQKSGHNNKTPYNKKSYKNRRDKNNRSSGHMVRISNLPHDIDDQELKNLLRFEYTYNDGKKIRCNWYIFKCFIMKNRYGYTGMVSFKFLDQAQYVVESLNKTPFANQILKVEILPPR